MAKRAFAATPGANCFVWLYDPTNGDVWNKDTPGEEVYSSANYAHYAIPATPKGASGIFEYTVPPTLPIGSWLEIPWLQGGASPIEGNDTPDDPRLLSWDGSAMTSPLVDGTGSSPVSITTLSRMLLAFLCGLDTLNDNGDGTQTVSFKKQDGISANFDVRFSKTNGARSTVTIH